MGIWVLYACGCWPWLYIGRGYIVLEHSTHLVWTRRSSHHASDVIVLWITHSVNIDRQAGRCVQRHCWHCVFIRCVGGCSPYLTQQMLDYLSLHKDWGECSEGWAGGVGVEVFSNWKHIPGVLKRKKKSFQKCSWGFLSGGGADFGVFGAPHAPTRGSRGVGKRYTSSYDHDLWPVWILERSGLAVKSYHPETLAAEEEKKNKK